MTTSCSQKDMFAPPVDGLTPLVLYVKKVQVPPNKSRKDQLRKTDRVIAPNYHIPSFKNSKMLVVKDFQGRPLRIPFLTTKPEFRQWMNKAVLVIESQLLSMCPIESGETLQGHSKLYAMLSRLPADDSVNDLLEGSWKVEMVSPGEEGAKIVIERLP